MTMNKKSRRPIAACVALLLLSGCGESSVKSSNAGGAGGEFVFDPAPYSELEIKGVPADGASSWGALEVASAPAPDEKSSVLGRELYAKACAACHGAEGKGDGLLATKVEFNSQPANFTMPLRSIKIRSTLVGSAPAESDLFRTITRGLPGSAMRSFRNLSASERWALVRRVGDFWRDKKIPAPNPVVIPPKIPSSPELLEAGRKMFAVCQNCHGAQALGGTAASFNAATGKMFPAIAFARGGGKFTYGGSSDEDLARTLLTGFSQTSPMMNFQPLLYGDDPKPPDLEAGNRKLWGTVYYSRQLIEAQAAK